MIHFLYWSVTGLGLIALTTHCAVLIRQLPETKRRRVVRRTRLIESSSKRF